MLLIDIILGIGILGFAGAGAKDGFIHSLGRVVGAVIGFVGARAWSLKLAPVMAVFMPVGWARLASFILIFIFITRLVGLVFKIVDGAFKILSVLPFLKSINSILGGLLGLVEGFILLGGATYLILTFNLENTLVQWLKASTLTPYILKVFQTLLGILL